MPAALLFLTLIGQSHMPWTLKIWRGLAGLQAIVILWYYCAWEQYLNLRYTECVLKPKMVALLGTTDFWAYEDQLRQSRSTRNTFDWWATIVLVCAWPICWHLATPMGLSRFIGWTLLSLNTGLFLAAISMQIKAISQRKKWVRDVHRVNLELRAESVNW